MTVPISKHESRDLSGSVFLISADGQMLRLPIPSISPSDPLNWTEKKRTGALLVMVFFTSFGLVQTQAISLLVPAIVREYSPNGLASQYLEGIISVPTIIFGISGFIWIPWSIAVGRRPVFLLSTIFMLLATGSAAISGSFNQLLLSLCFQGMATGVSVSAFLLILIDMTFIAERPHVIAMFWALPSAFSCLILPAIPKMVVSESGWRTFYKISVIPSAVAILLAFLFYPETYFQRPAVAFNGYVLLQSATEKVSVYEGWEDVPGGHPLPDRPDRSRFVTILKMLKPWGWQRGGWVSMRACYIQITLCVINPLILWVTILNAATFGGMMCVGMTYASVLGAEPYSLDIHTIALINFGAAAGAFLAWPASGLMISRICWRLTLRNGGVREAEQYLSAFVLPVLVGTASLALYGLAGERYWNWKWMILFWGLNEFSCISLFTATTLWVTEAFPRWAAAALVVVGCGSYAISFGLSYLILPWIKSQGFARAYIELGGIVFAVGCLGIPIVFLGKNFRQRFNGRWAMNAGGSLRPQTGEP